MIYDIRYLETHFEGGWSTVLQIQRTASSDWENVRTEKVMGEQKKALPIDDLVRSLS